MATSIVELKIVGEKIVAVAEPVVNKESWRAWVERGRRHDGATVRKLRLAAVAAFVMGLGVYFLVLR